MKTTENEANSPAGSPTRPCRARVGLAWSWLLLLSGALESQAGPRERPNIIFMLSDDQSWAGLSVAMHPELENSRSRLVQTPNLERLAAQGMRFSAAYSPAPVCSPTRISIQTGRSPASLHWTKASRSASASDGHKLIPPVNIRQIPASDTTIGELLRASGYATAHYGKWHLNGGGPGANGYDEHDGDIGNEHASKFSDPNPVDIFGMAKRAIGFMKKCKESKKPFFIQMSWHALHSPENALKKTLEKYRQLARGGNAKSVSRAAIAEDLDTGVGQIMGAVDALGLAESTYVIYMSDNGGGGGGGGGGGRGRRSARRQGGGDNADRVPEFSGLAGGKGSLSEGGIRVPLIIRGPGVAPNSWSHVPVTGLDLLPTFCEWARAAKLPEGIEGGSFVEILSNKGKGTVRRPREEIVFHFPHYQDLRGPQSSIRLGSFKLLKYYEDERVVLFDLSRDLAETTDLSAKLPDKTATLEKQLEKYLRDVKAQMPRPNLRYDPNNPPSPRKRRRRGRR